MSHSCKTPPDPPRHHRWVIATSLRDVPMEEQQAAFRQMMGG